MTATNAECLQRYEASCPEDDGVCKKACRDGCALGVPTLSDWATMPPWSKFQDVAHHDAENMPDPAKLLDIEKTEKRMNYFARSGRYCPKQNIQLEGLKVPIDGYMQPLKAHQCYQKCAV